MHALNVRSGGIRWTAVENVFFEKKLGVADITSASIKDFYRRRYPSEHAEAAQYVDEHPDTLILDFENHFGGLEKHAREGRRDVTMKLAGWMICLCTCALQGCSTPAPSQGWTFTFDAASAEELERARTGVQKLITEIKSHDLTPTGSALTTHRGGDGVEIRDVKTSWTGTGFGVRNLRIEVSERNAPAAGPEVSVFMSAPVPSDEVSLRFDELQRHVAALINPKNP